MDRPQLESSNAKVEHDVAIRGDPAAVREIEVRDGPQRLPVRSAFRNYLDAAPEDQRKVFELVNEWRTAHFGLTAHISAAGHGASRTAWRAYSIALMTPAWPQSTSTMSSFGGVDHQVHVLSEMSSWTTPSGVHTVYYDPRQRRDSLLERSLPTFTFGKHTNALLVAR